MADAAGPAAEENLTSEGPSPSSKGLRAQGRVLHCISDSLTIAMHWSRVVDSFDTPSFLSVQCSRWLAEFHSRVCAYVSRREGYSARCKRSESPILCHHWNSASNNTCPFQLATISFSKRHCLLVGPAPNPVPPEHLWPRHSKSGLVLRKELDAMLGRVKTAAWQMALPVWCRQGRKGPVSRGSLEEVIL